MNDYNNMELPIWVHPGPYFLQDIHVGQQNAAIKMAHRDTDLILRVDFDTCYSLTTVRESFNFRRYKRSAYDFSYTFHNVENSSLLRKFHFDSYDLYQDNPPIHLLLTPIANYIDIVGCVPDFVYLSGTQKRTNGGRVNSAGKVAYKLGKHVFASSDEVWAGWKASEVGSTKELVTGASGSWSTSGSGTSQFIETMSASAEKITYKVQDKIDGYVIGTTPNGEKFVFGADPLKGTGTGTLDTKWSDTQFYEQLKKAEAARDNAKHPDIKSKYQGIMESIRVVLNGISGIDGNP